MAKDFEITITKTQIFKVYVEATNWEEAENQVSAMDHGAPIDESISMDTEEA